MRRYQVGTERGNNFCPEPYRRRRGGPGPQCCSIERCPQCCSTEFATHWCAICSDDRGHLSKILPHVRCIRKSAERESGKCRRCMMILASLERHFVKKYFAVEITPSSPRSLEKDESIGRSNNESLIVRGRTLHSYESIEIFTLPNTTSPWRGIGAASELSQDSYSERTFEQARKWLTDCYKNHDQCGQLKDHHPLPTRLIDVLSSQERGPVKLIETSSGQEGRYLCLSHCWGDPERHPRPLETKHETVESHKQEIPYMSLPKAFQDAVSFVRLLGESYIWIDSLCIIQDCPDDWHQEATKMADVFSNSYLTLAATKSTNSTESLFSTPDDSYKASSYNFEEHGSTYTLYFRKSLPHFFNRWDDGLEYAPLLQRAWAYQERVLSPRTLHFGNQELLWECREVTTCECGRWVDSLWTKICPRVDVPPRKLRGSKLKSLWHRAVEDYSSLELTKESDRLPAIAGIAKRMQCVQGLTGYLAGLWKESLLEDLLWRRRSIFVVDDRPSGWKDTSVAPSWSWVCVKGIGITFDSDLNIYNRVAILVDAEVQSDQKDAFTKASSGRITIKSYLFTAKRPDEDRRPVFLVLEPSSTVTTASSDNFADNSSNHRWANDLRPPKGENVAEVGIKLEALDYYPDERNGPEDKPPEDSSIRFLLMHAKHITGQYLLALRPKEGRLTFERIGLDESRF